MRTALRRAAGPAVLALLASVAVAPATRRGPGARRATTPGGTSEPAADTRPWGGSLVHVTGYYPPFVGGLERVVASLATEQARTAGRVEVLTSAVHAEALTGSRIEDGVRVRRYRYRRLATTPIFPGLVVGLLRQPRGTVVHVHHPIAYVAEVSVVVCRLRGLPFVLHEHLEVGPTTRLGVLLPLYRRLVVGPTMRHADRVLALTDDMRSHLVDAYRLDPARVVVVPNAVDPAIVEATAAAAGAAGGRHRGPAEAGGAEGSPDAGADPTLHVVFVGRLVFQKQVDRLIEAVSRCAQPVRLIVVGEGDQRDVLEQHARDLGVDVGFTGALDREGVAGWLAWADVFAVASEREGMPLSVLEAMAAGVPVLATDAPGLRDLVADHGLLVEPGAEALAAGLDRLAQDPQLREDLARRGLERAARDTWPRVAARLGAEYAAIAPSGPGSHRTGVEQWRPLDVTDASWARIQYTRTLWGIEPVSVDRMREAVADLLARSESAARMLDPATRSERPMTAAEIAAAPTVMVRAGAPHASADDADRATYAIALDGLPFVLVVGPTYLSVRTTHVFGDEWTTLTLLGHLVARTRSDQPLPLPWDSVSSRARTWLTVTQLARRPRAVVAALARRSELSGGAVEPARDRVDRLRHTCTHVASPDGFVSRLRAERRERGLDVSLAAVCLVGLRRTIGHHLEVPARGAEIVYDVRRESSLTQRAYGNWVAGVFVVPEDDTDVTSVSRALTQVRESGLSLIAAAATRRRSKQGHDDQAMVFAPEGGLRLTLSYIPGHGPLRGIDLVGPDAAYVGTNPPNGAKTITLTCAEIGDRMHFALMHYESVWTPEQVRAAIEEFVSDPWGSTP